MTAANVAGFSRILLAGVAAGLLIHKGQSAYGIVAAVTVAAIVTDILDGVLARRYGTLSSFGAFLDVTADKIFVAPLLFMIADGRPLRLWAAFLITSRDFVVMGLRSYVATRGQVLAARRLGKAKSILLYPATLLLLLRVPSGEILLVLATALALVSLGDYLAQARRFLHDDLHSRRD